MLAGLKPSLRRISATALIVLTTMIYGALNAALTKETSRQMSEAFLGEPLASKIKYISKTFPASATRKLPLSASSSQKRIPKGCCLFGINGLREIFSCYLSAPIFLHA